MRQFILDRLTLAIPDSHPLSAGSPEPTLKKVVDKQSLLSIESSKLFDVIAWNDALEEILRSPEIEDTLSWIVSLIRDCYLYLQLTSAIYLSFMRCPKKPSVDAFNHAAVLYIQSSHPDQQAQALEGLSNEACYLLRNNRLLQMSEQPHVYSFKCYQRIQLWKRSALIYANVSINASINLRAH